MTNGIETLAEIGRLLVAERRAWNGYFTGHDEADNERLHRVYMSSLENSTAAADAYIAAQDAPEPVTDTRAMEALE